jgi:hypothetical protein
MPRMPILLIGRLQHILSMAGQNPRATARFPRKYANDGADSEPPSVTATDHRRTQIPGCIQSADTEDSGTLDPVFVNATYSLRSGGGGGGGRGIQMEASFSRRNGRKWRCCDNRFFTNDGTKSYSPRRAGELDLDSGLYRRDHRRQQPISGRKWSICVFCRWHAWNVLATRNCSPNR